MFVAGTAMFSGSCYWKALHGPTPIDWITPYGGLTLIFAWLSLALTV